ncbi:MAG: type II secretion system protein [Candidatus Omnitrophica bacterium]|nr:type II secretion system protein [Candidatus Omnitrophota bacterium]MBI2173987.1 type II secretion system protein [Candidatus Omnitrophota bacterium]MBI3009716.1 type II secretion system protein [Candidatus Omnitrophota bacterium]
MYSLRGFKENAFTLVELLLSAFIVVVALVSILGATSWQIATDEQSRNLSWSEHDAMRIMEQLRLQNKGGSCGLPVASAPSGFASWDAWLASTSATGGGGKSIQPDPANNEQAVVSFTGTDPLRVTVTVCWRQRGRAIGECWSGDVDADGTLESPAMLTTLITCRP